MGQIWMFFQETNKHKTPLVCDLYVANADNGNRISFNSSFKMFHSTNIFKMWYAFIALFLCGVLIFSLTTGLQQCCLHGKWKKNDPSDSTHIGNLLYLWRLTIKPRNVTGSMWKLGFYHYWTLQLELPETSTLIHITIDMKLQKI